LKERTPTELEVFGCNWKEWANGIANSEFMRVAISGGRPRVAEALAMMTVMVITDAQRFVAEGNYVQSIQLLNCLKRLIANPEELMGLVTMSGEPPENDSVIH